MPRGRPPKPVAELQRIGTFRTDRHMTDIGSNLPAVRAEINQPGELIEVFDRVLSEGVGWLKSTDEPTLALLRHLLIEADELRLVVKMDASQRKDLRDVTKQIMLLLSALGFDPTSRSRLGIAEVKTRSRLQEIQDRAKRANA